MKYFKLGQLVKIPNGDIERIVGVDKKTDVLPYLTTRPDSGIYLHQYFGEKTMTFYGGIPDMEQVELWNHNDLIPVKTDNNSDVWVRRFASGAIRSDDRGREKPSFVSPYAIKFIAQHFSANADFFNGNDSGKNYMKGITPKHIQDSLLRHTLDLQFAMLPGNEDVSATKKALVEIGANVVMALHQIGLAEDGKYVEVFEDLAYVKREEAYDNK